MNVENKLVCLLLEPNFNQSMILIISTEDDVSTSHVIDWLIYFGADFIRINSSDLFEIDYFELTNDGFDCIIENVTIN